MIDDHAKLPALSAQQARHFQIARELIEILENHGLADAEYIEVLKLASVICELHDCYCKNGGMQ